MQVIGLPHWYDCYFFTSALLVLFFFPIWNNLKKYAAVYRSLEGINAVVVGIMIGSTFYIMKDISLIEAKTISAINVTVILSTIFILDYTRIPAPVIVVSLFVIGISSSKVIFYNNRLFQFLLLLFQGPYSG